MPSRRLSDRNYDYLRVLRFCLLNNGGWEWRGARGWMFSTEFPYPIAGLAAGFLSSLANNYLVAREDVSDPFVQRPSNFYRITQLGIELLAEREREQRAALGSDDSEPGVIVFPTSESAASVPYQPEPIIVPALADSRSEVERDTIFVAQHQWKAVAFLQTQPEEGWFTLGAVRDVVGRFDSDDACLLAGKALLGESKPDVRGQWKYRASLLGRGARLRDGDTNKRLAMVHVAGIRTAAAATQSDRSERRPRSSRRVGPTSGG
jgi:hypothetical protein